MLSSGIAMYCRHFIQVKISLIITTYNSPSYLDWVLASVCWQSILPSEVIVADDGSSVETSNLISKYCGIMKVPLVHSYQPDRGFRLSRSRNLAVSKARFDWVIFLDGDCILPIDFIESVMSLMDEQSIIFGSRKLLSDRDSQTLANRLPSYERLRSLFSGRKFLKLPLGILRRIPSRSWKAARGFMFCISRRNLLELGGFDENFVSWGLEDSDFFVRALRSRLLLVDSRYKTSVLHLFHPEPDKNMESENSRKLQSLLQNGVRTLPNKTVLLAGEYK